jgi:hypothetical protein
METTGTVSPASTSAASPDPQTTPPTVDAASILDAMEAREWQMDSIYIINPDIERCIENRHFQRIGFCVRTSESSPDQKTKTLLQNSILRLKAIWNILCVEPELNPRVECLNITLRGSSRDFSGMRGKDELFSLFNKSGPPFVVSGLDGLTTDIEGILEFPNSYNHQHSVEILWIEGRDLRVRTSWLDLQYSLQEWLYSIQQLPLHPGAPRHQLQLQVHSHWSEAEPLPGSSPHRTAI